MCTCTCVCTCVLTCVHVRMLIMYGYALVRLALQGNIKSRCWLFFLLPLILKTRAASVRAQACLHACETCATWVYALVCVHVWGASVHLCIMYRTELLFSTISCLIHLAPYHTRTHAHKCTWDYDELSKHVADQKHRCTLQAKSTDARCRPKAQMHVAGQKHRCMLQAKSTDARLQIPGQAKATCSRKTYQLILAYHIIKRPLC